MQISISKTKVQKIRNINKHKLQRKRAKEKRKRVTRCESPSPNLVKKGTRKKSKHLVLKPIQILKRPPIAFLPNPKASIGSSKPIYVELIKKYSRVQLASALTVVSLFEWFGIN